MHKGVIDSGFLVFCAHGSAIKNTKREVASIKDNLS